MKRLRWLILLVALVGMVAGCEWAKEQVVEAGTEVAIDMGTQFIDGQLASARASLASVAEAVGVDPATLEVMKLPDDATPQEVQRAALADAQRLAIVVAEVRSARLAEGDEEGAADAVDMGLQGLVALLLIVAGGWLKSFLRDKINGHAIAQSVANEVVAKMPVAKRR